MQQIRFVTLMAAIVISTSVSAVAQSTKYDRGGNLSSISGLLVDATGCEASQSYTGTIAKIKNADSEHAVGYEFSLRLPNGRRQNFEVSISNEDGELIIDFADLMVRNRKITVKARRCGSAGFNTVEEIRRL